MMCVCVCSVMTVLNWRGGSEGGEFLNFHSAMRYGVLKYSSNRVQFLGEIVILLPVVLCVLSLTFSYILIFYCMFDVCSNLFSSNRNESKH